MILFQMSQVHTMIVGLLLSESKVKSDFIKKFLIHLRRVIRKLILYDFYYVNLGHTTMFKLLIRESKLGYSSKSKFLIHMKRV